MRISHWLLVTILFAGACSKSEFTKPEIGTFQTVDVKPFASQWIPTALIQQFNWDQQVPLLKNDTLIAVKVMSKNNESNTLQYLIVHFQGGRYTEVVFHQIFYEGKPGLSKPLSISSKNFTQNISATSSLRATEFSNGHEPNRRGTVKKSHPAPQLPMAYCKGRYNSSGNEVFSNPVNYVLINGAFVPSGGGGGLSGGGDGGSNDYNPYLYLDYLDPLWVPDAGNPAILDAATNRIYNEWIYNINDYPGKELGFPFAYWERPSTPQEAVAMAAIAEEFEPWEESPCRGTARIGGNPNWTGTIEHLTIQLYYMGTHPMQSTREYKIPNAGATMGIPGYADIVNTTTGEIFEIKPPSSIQQGASEVANYVTKANAFCANGVPYRPGSNFSTVVLPYFTKPGKGMKVSLEPGGVLKYEPVDSRPSPVILPVPQTVTDRLKSLIRKLVEHPDFAEYQIREFFSDSANARLKDALKTAVIGAGIAVVVGTIVEDVLSGGLGLMDDIAHFTMAYRAIRFAIAL